MLTSEKTQGPSLGKIQVKLPHQRSAYALKFEDRSLEETERQERCVHRDACTLAKNIFKLKENDKNALVQSCPEPENVGDSITADHKVLLQ